jgi:glutathione synthase/RimK-type ligase-like ATP-grasp enzyme
VTTRLALATCAALPDLDPDDAPLVAALRARGIEVETPVWNAPDVDWSSYDAVVVRSTWDYTERPRDFRWWAQRVSQSSRLINPAQVLTWNIDKTYQRAMEAAGLPIVPTIWMDPARNFNARAIHTRFPAFGDFVIKPTVSAGSRDTGRYDAGQTPSRALAITHVKHLLEENRHVMVQRYLKQVDTVGETALVYFDGQLSHTVRKAPLLEGPYREGDSEGVLYKEEVMTSREASEAELAVGQRVVDALPELIQGVEQPLAYTRVDLIPDDAGNPVVLELELIEPSFFFAQAPEAVDRFADAITRRL